MVASLRRAGLLAAAGLSLLVACTADSVVAPEAQQQAPTAASKDLLGSATGVVTGLVQADGLLRTKALAKSITVSKTIGVDGGTLAIPDAGVTVTVPRGALKGNTLITMTARAGSMVAYDFAPHGITFAKPLSFSQKLSGTNATLLGAPFLKLGYYPDESLLGKTTALVSEVIGGTLNLLSWTMNSQISHFSGYVILCGRSDDQ